MTNCSYTNPILQVCKYHHTGCCRGNCCRCWSCNCCSNCGCCRRRCLCRCCCHCCSGCLLVNWSCQWFCDHNQLTSKFVNIDLLCHWYTCPTHRHTRWSYFYDSVEAEFRISDFAPKVWVILPTWCYTLHIRLVWYNYAMILYLSVWLAEVGVLSKRINGLSWILAKKATLDLSYTVFLEKLDDFKCTLCFKRNNPTILFSTLEMKPKLQIKWVVEELCIVAMCLLSLMNKNSVVVGRVKGKVECRLYRDVDSWKECLQD